MMDVEVIKEPKFNWWSFLYWVCLRKWVKFRLAGTHITARTWWACSAIGTQFKHAYMVTWYDHSTTAERVAKATRELIAAGYTKTSARDFNKSFVDLYRLHEDLFSLLVNVPGEKKLFRPDGWPSHFAILFTESDALEMFSKLNGSHLDYQHFVHYVDSR